MSDLTMQAILEMKRRGEADAKQQTEPKKSVRKTQKPVVKSIPDSEDEKEA